MRLVLERIYRETADELHAYDETALQPGRDSSDFVKAVDGGAVSLLTRGAVLLFFWRRG